MRDAAGVEPLAVTSDVGEALAYLAGKPVVCCGTITLIGEVKGLYEQGKAGTAPCGADPR